MEERFCLRVNLLDQRNSISFNSNGSLLVFLETGLADAVGPSPSLLTQAWPAVERN